jgi:pyruvate dehydrogenase E2 component (dihydrolipoamide acetyltransferase)
MPALFSFRLPDVGEGLTEAEILRWTVKPGDRVEVNQVIVEIETVKAAVELPSPYAGTVTTLLAAEGDTVPVGTPIITLDTGANVPDGDPAPGLAPGLTEPAGPGEPVAPGEPAAPGEPVNPGLLVGYGPRDAGPRRHRPPVPAQVQVPAHAQVPAGAAVPAGAVQTVTRPAAKPPVRKLAKDLGVDLRLVPPTGPGGTISRDDVQAALARAAVPQSPHADADTTAPHQDPGTAGARETRIPIRGVRKHTAAAMVRSAFTAPHVTEFITVDISATMELRDRVAARPEFRDVKLSPLAFVARALLLAVERTPEINASWDESAQEIVLKHYVNLGIAAATDRGLMVPNIKQAHGLSLLELACGINDLAATARAGAATAAQLTGGTITITNVGVWGVDTGTPILNPGEAAILAVGAIRRQPWVVGSGAHERIEPRWVTQLALSFDHRLVDGQQGSQALAHVAAILTDPGLALL